VPGIPEGGDRSGNEIAIRRNQGVESVKHVKHVVEVFCIDANVHETSQIIICKTDPVTPFSYKRPKLFIYAICMLYSGLMRTQLRKRGGMTRLKTTEPRDMYRLSGEFVKENGARYPVQGRLSDLDGNITVSGTLTLDGNKEGKYVSGKRFKGTITPIPLSELIQGLPTMMKEDEMDSAVVKTTHDYRMQRAIDRVIEYMGDDWKPSINRRYMGPPQLTVTLTPEGDGKRDRLQWVYRIFPTIDHENKYRYYVGIHYRSKYMSFAFELDSISNETNLNYNVRPGSIDEPDFQENVRHSFQRFATAIFLPLEDGSEWASPLSQHLTDLVIQAGYAKNEIGAQDFVANFKNVHLKGAAWLKDEWTKGRLSGKYDDMMKANIKAWNKQLNPLFGGSRRSRPGGGTERAKKKGGGGRPMSSMTTASSKKQQSGGARAMRNNSRSSVVSSPSSRRKQKL